MAAADCLGRRVYEMICVVVMDVVIVIALLEGKEQRSMQLAAVTK